MYATIESNENPAVYFVGPSGWSYSDWSGIVYPAGASKRFDPLAYLAKYFTAIEINVSFYRPVTHRICESWVRRVSDRRRFKFAAKLHQSFTHDRSPYSKDSVRTFVEGLTPLVESARLGCLLMQFPWSFRRTVQAVDRLKRLAGDFDAAPLVAELRHDSWATDETYGELRAMGVGMGCIDQPPLAHCMKPSSVVTSRIGYVRLHGRRTDTWFADNVPTFERYNYLYRPAELEEWRPRIESLGSTCEEVYVFANNHYRGQGPANALQLQAMLEGRRVPVPPSLADHFPDLSSISEGRSDSFPEVLF